MFDIPTWSNIPTWVAVAGGIIGIISAVVSVTVYITKLRIEGNRKTKAYEEELKEKRSTIGALESSVQGLTQSLLNSILGEIRNANGATADSILIRDPFAEETLIFLTVHGEAAEKIKRMKVSVKESQRLGRPVKEISNRIGVASGPVIGSTMGHPQYLSYTVMGQPVNSAAYLCDEARRTQSGVLICRNTFETVERDLNGVARFVPRDFESGDRGFEVHRFQDRHRAYGSDTPMGTGLQEGRSCRLSADSHGR